MRDPELKMRAMNLPKLLQHRWADSTNKKYEQAWNRWNTWCDEYPEVNPCPAESFYIALYLNDLVLEGCKIGALDAAAAGIRWGHILAGFGNPIDNIFVKTGLEGAKRTIGKSKGKNQKEPFTTEMAKRLVDQFGNSTNLFNHRTIVICLLAFSGFLRVGELIEIQMKYVKFSGTHMEITIPKAKNDQLREGHVVYISRTWSPYCPVFWAETYIRRTDLANEPDSYLISRLSSTKRGHKAIGKRKLSDSTVRDIFRRDISPICTDHEPGSYSLHSFRSGGASTAVNNGIDERLIGKHGRWKSGYSRDRYLKDSKSERLRVSKSLGL